MCRVCTECGTLLEDLDVAFSSEPTFEKTAAGDATVQGQFVSGTHATRALGRISNGRLYGYQVSDQQVLQAVLLSHFSFVAGL